MKANIEYNTGTSEIYYEFLGEPNKTFLIPFHNITTYQFDNWGDYKELTIYTNDGKTCEFRNHDWYNIEDFIYWYKHYLIKMHKINKKGRKNGSN